jgi:hypothetical protein
MLAATRFILLCNLLSISLSSIAFQLAQAKLGPISIRSVYTTDESDNNKIVFRPGPGTGIHYHVDVDNTTGSPFPIDVRFQAFANDYSPDPTLYHYDQTYHLDQMPVGLSRFYNPTTLPSSTACERPPCPPVYKDFYAVRITITPSGCQGTACENDGDWGESKFTIQSTDAPTGKTSTGDPNLPASNLIVLVHGCCTDATAVSNEWDSLRNQIINTITQRHPGNWEVVVWDWHEYTPPPLPGQVDPDTWRQGADVAYQNAKHQGAVLADTIKLYPYNHVHFIGHSAGAKLIHEAATAYISDYLIRQNTPFLHLTFLDAYTPALGSDKDAYGSLPIDYPNHYSEHYVDRFGLPFTDACLSHAFNFEITNWPSDCSSELDPFCRHQWPSHWYKDSVAQSGFKYGFPLSFESGYDRDKVANEFPPGQQGQQCSHFLENTSSECLPPAPCW